MTAALVCKFANCKNKVTSCVVFIAATVEHRETFRERQLSSFNCSETQRQQLSKTIGAEFSAKLEFWRKSWSFFLLTILLSSFPDQRCADCCQHRLKSLQDSVKEDKNMRIKYSLTTAKL